MKKIKRNKISIEIGILKPSTPYEKEVLDIKIIFNNLGDIIILLIFDIFKDKVF